MACDALFGSFGKKSAVLIHGQNFLRAEGNTDTTTFAPVIKYRYFGVAFGGQIFALFVFLNHDFSVLMEFYGW